jgi:hypothetical protein
MVRPRVDRGQTGYIGPIPKDSPFMGGALTFT